MNIEQILEESEIPQVLIDFKIQHYKEIFGQQWEKVFQAGQSLEKGEKMFVLKNLGTVVGGCAIKKNTYALQLRNFSILPGFTGKGFARKFMQSLEEIAKNHHYELIKSDRKPKDIDLMYLRSLVYLDYDNPEAASLPALQFGRFLDRLSFSPCAYNKHELSGEEKIAVEVYKELYPNLADRLRVFKKLVINKGVELKPESKQELLKLNKQQWDVVMSGLNWKLGHYRKSGEVSYKYNVCPICENMGRKDTIITEEMLKSSRPCPAEDCYIYLTCMEPFRKAGRFKEDFEVSNAYFSAMRDFMLGHPPKD